LVDEFESKLNNFADETAVSHDEKRRQPPTTGRRGRGRRPNNAGEMVEESKSDIDDKENRVYSQDMRSGSNAKKFSKSKTTGNINNRKKKRLVKKVKTTLL
jgi:hypothetical protein